MTSTASAQNLTLANLRKTYSGKAVIDNLSLEVRPGELLTLLGPSGGGKTTTLRLIAGLTPHDAGGVAIGGRSMDGLRPAQRDVAMVFQDAALYPHLSVQKNLAFPLRVRKVPPDEIDRRVTHAAELCDIVDLLDRKPGTLSGGEMQRAAVARALIRQPTVLLMDEPLSNLDAPLRSRLRSDLRQLQKKLNITTLYVTHDQEEAMALGDRLAVMAGGTIQQVGTPMEVYRTPANRFVAGFLGQPGMNFIHGRLVRKGESVSFVDASNIQIEVNDAPAEMLGEVVLGIRPENLHVDSRGSSTNKCVIPAEHTFTELLGDRCFVHGRTAAGDEIIARIANDLADRCTGTLAFSCDAKSIHLFEPGDFGRRLPMNSDENASRRIPS